MTHGTKSGVAHFVVKNEYECMDRISRHYYHIFHKTILKKLQLYLNDDDPNRLDHNL